MLAKRIIPCLDVRDGVVVKGVQFRNHEVMGSIIDLAKRYADEGADELVFYDITASSDNRRVDKSWVAKVAEVINIPFAVAGGIKSVEDARTILQYNSNMRQLVYDKLKSCELVVFNRFDPGMDKMEYHKLVRAASPRADIAFEYPDGKVEYDDIVDPLPFDLDAPVVEIGDEHYALWYRDLSEEPKKYEGKTVRFKCRALVRQKLPAETFVAGRHVMTCCVEDIQFAGLVCQWKDAKSIRDDSWMILTAELHFKFNRAYGKRGPVLTYLSSEPCEPPENPVATFY